MYGTPPTAFRYTKSWHCIEFALVLVIKILEVLNMAFTVTKDTIIGDILDNDFGVAPFFLEIGMHCLGCPSSRGESIEEACAVHGTNADELVEKLNNYFATK
jgi:hybrid cluster-associated redox disulfide protein